MSTEINLGGAIYISSRQAAEKAGYSQDYVGQLARSGAIEARRVSGLWYILESSLMDYKEKADQFTPTPPQKAPESDNDSRVSIEGHEYISASRASDLSGYSADYVSQLARNGKIGATQAGGRWFVDLESLTKHKREKDALLGAVQSESVGIRDAAEINDISDEYDVPSVTHYTYSSSSLDGLFPLAGRSSSERESGHGLAHVDSMRDEHVVDQVNVVPIRVVEEDLSATVRVFEQDGQGRLHIWPLFGAFGAVMVMLLLSFQFLPRVALLEARRPLMGLWPVEHYLVKDLSYMRAGRP